MTEFVNKTKEAITLTITEIESTLMDDLITIESLEKLFIEQYLKQIPRPLPPKNTAIKECTEELSIEKSMDDSLEEKKHWIQKWRKMSVLRTTKANLRFLIILLSINRWL